MHKLVLTTMAFIFLFALALTTESQATTYGGLLALEPSDSLLLKVECPVNGQTIQDDLCGNDKHLVCEKADPSGPLKCRCIDCGGHGNCPTNTRICCLPGTCCHCGTGGFKCCPG
jgi:hypothetical protein